MTTLLNVILPVFLAAGLAALVQPYLKLDVQVLSRATFYIFSPALAFYSLATSEIAGDEFAQIAAVQILVTLMLWGLGEIAARLMRLKGPTRGAFLVAIVLMNSANYGFPVSLFAFGEEGLARAVIYFVVSTMLRSSLCVYLVARSRASARQALRSVFSVPVLYTAVVGFAVNLTGWAVPQPLLRATQILGQGAVPALMIVLGVQLADVFRRSRNTWNVPALATVTVSRLLLAPLLAVLISPLLGLQGLTRNVVVLESAMPTAVMALVLATEYDADPPFAALSVFVTTLASLLTVTVLLNWLLAA